MDAEGMMRVVLRESDVGEDASWLEADEDDESRWPERLHDVPAAKVARWEAAREAWEQVQREINALVKARAALSP